MKEKRSYRVYNTIMIVVLTAFITFFISSLVGYNYLIKGDGKTMVLNSMVEEQDIATKLSAYRGIIEKYFLGDIDDEKLEEGAIKGYIEGLDDPYTEYISKDEMEEYMENTMGNYVGIGIYMVLDEDLGKIKVLTPMENSPAEQAGIQPGDIIVAVDGETYTKDEMSKVSDKIKGKEGTTVKLQIQRGEEILELEVKRESIKVNPVNGKVIENNIGYIEFSSFDESTAEDFKNKYEELKNQNITSLIIDLRNNGGGLVDQATDIADLIIEKGNPILYEVDKNGKETVINSENDPIIDMPIVIITNENTASASEILAGALKDYGKAKIVGTKTYGKGVIQEILTLTDGSGLKITTEEYQTPNHNKIQKVGIEPDITVELPETVTNILNVPEDQDTQLQKAIETVKSME